MLQLKSSHVRANHSCQMVVCAIWPHAPAFGSTGKKKKVQYGVFPSKAVTPRHCMPASHKRPNDLKGPSSPSSCRSSTPIALFSCDLAAAACFCKCLVLRDAAPSAASSGQWDKYCYRLDTCGPAPYLAFSPTLPFVVAPSLLLRATARKEGGTYAHALWHLLRATSSAPIVPLARSSKYRKCAQLLRPSCISFQALANSAVPWLSIGRQKQDAPPLE